MQSIHTPGLASVRRIAARAVTRFLFALHAALLYLSIYQAASVLNPVRPELSSHYMWHPISLVNLFGIALLSALLYSGTQFRDCNRRRQMLILQSLWTAYLCFWIWWSPASRIAPTSWGWFLAILSILFVAPHLTRWEYKRIRHQGVPGIATADGHWPEWCNKILGLAANLLASCAILGAACYFCTSTREDFDWGEHETYRSVLAAIYMSAVLLFSIDAARGRRAMLPVGIATATIVGFL